MSSLRFIIMVENIDNTQRLLIHNQLKDRAESWWHELRDVWIVQGGDSVTEWRNVLSPLVSLAGSKLLVLGMSEEKPRWAGKGFGPSKTRWLTSPHGSDDETTRSGSSVDDEVKRLLISAQQLSTNRRNIDLVDSLYHRALEVMPGNVNVESSYATFLLRLKGDSAQAISILRRIVEHEPDRPSALGNLGTSLLHFEHNHVEAERVMRRAMTLDPTNPNFVGNYAQLLFWQGRRAEALAMVEHARTLKPQPPLQLELAFYDYAHVPERRREALDSIREFLTGGTRSLGWVFTEDIRLARESDHPAADLLQELASVIADDGDLEDIDWDQAL